jgi:membrane-bound ClpP family serine protease
MFEAGTIGVLVLIAALTGSLNLIIVGVVGYMVMKTLAVSIALGMILVFIALTIFFFQLWKARQMKKMADSMARHGITGKTAEEVATEVGGAAGASAVGGA